MSDKLKMTLWRSPLPQSEPTPEYWQLLYKQADSWAQQLVAVSEAVGTRQSRQAELTRQGPTDWNRASCCQLISPVRR